jgi:serine/threonine-protein kinase
MSPQTIAHYRITAKLGGGGMGEVYRATDTKLGRDVAIKILPESFAHDPDRLARFTREAQVLASLNHPNIAAIYGVEDRALVMELVEGPTLAERMEKRAMLLEEAQAGFEPRRRCKANRHPDRQRRHDRRHRRTGAGKAQASARALAAA